MKQDTKGQEKAQVRPDAPRERRGRKPGPKRKDLRVSLRPLRLDEAVTAVLAVEMPKAEAK